MTVHREHLNDEAATLALGRRLARGVRAGLVIHLSGDLGAGKTTLTRGLLAGLGHVGKVKSPTYTLVEPYTLSRLDFYHFDLYRFKDEQEWHDAGFRDYFRADSVGVIEWPEKAVHLVPAPDVRITLTVTAAGRDALIEGTSENGDRCVAQLRSANEPSAPPRSA